MVTELRQREDLEQLLEKSRNDPVLIFKHSTQCSVSDAAYGEFRQFLSHSPDITAAVVLVIENKSLSDRIAAQFGIRHESPQAIVVEDGRAIWNASHWAITEAALLKATSK
jgi:bacillithiol system protein YtxJ